MRSKIECALPPIDTPFAIPRLIGIPLKVFGFIALNPGPTATGLLSAAPGTLD